MERFFLDYLKENGDTVQLERPVLPASIEIDSSKAEDTSAYPITLTLRHLTEDEGTPSQGSSVPNGLFRSNLTADDTEDLIRKSSGKEGSEETIGKVALRAHEHNRVQPR